MEAYDVIHLYSLYSISHNEEGKGKKKRMKDRCREKGKNQAITGKDPSRGGVITAQLTERRSECPNFSVHGTNFASESRDGTSGSHSTNYSMG
jgi:hypothetical protein